MATIILKLTDLSQYNPISASITWNDKTPKRWDEVYGQVKKGDNCIILSGSELFVGDYSSTVYGISLTFNNIKAVKISTDDLLRIDLLNPETLAVIKRPPGPLLKHHIDVNRVFNEAVAENFISFYIVKKGKETNLLSSLNANDRVVTVDQNGTLIELLKLDSGLLRPKILSSGYFGSKGKTLAEILTIMSAADRKNHIKNIKRVISELGKSDYYKFPSFNDYYNIIHNKGLYSGLGPTPGGRTIDTEDDSENNNDVFETPKNIILYGPPGTGKTYHSVTHAVAIIESKEVEAVEIEDRELVKIRFDQYVKDGQIIFCTFHQSLSYEDFIEGIKPMVPESEDEQLFYSVEDGIFKRLCTEAAFSFVKQQTNPETEKALDFSTAYDLYVDTVNENLSKGEKTEIATRSGGNVTIESVSQKDNLIIRHIDGTRTYIVSKKRLSKLSQAFPELDEVTNINNQFRTEIGGSNSSAYWAVLNAIRTQSLDAELESSKNNFEKEYSYEDKKEIIKSLKSEDYEVENPKKFVIIIDEINRGNVSQIFGELITLIEEDKRLGKDEALLITLPYSKDKFGVPQNLYIVGTMNTADRSVEALDTALRRRFSFVTKMPEENKLKVTDDGLNLPRILETINTRLRVLKDNDHTIGHAWLWSVSNTEQLKVVFEHKILPLLQEYFYNDYEKMGLVLGDAFFKPHKQISSNIFASFTGGNGLSGQYDQSWQYFLKPANELTTADFKTLEIQLTQPETDETE